MILVFSHFGFEGGICPLIAQVPVHCFLITFICEICFTVYNNRTKINDNDVLNHFVPIVMRIVRLL